MIRIVLAFCITFLLFFFGIKALRSLTGKEAWELTKLVSYSILCSLLAFMALAGLVILF